MMTMRVWQVLGSGSPGAPSSLFLYTDHSRYIFNCGEGSQRMVRGQILTGGGGYISKKKQGVRSAFRLRIRIHQPKIGKSCQENRR